MSHPHRGGMPSLPDSQRRGVICSTALSEQEAELAIRLVGRWGEQSRSSLLRRLLLDAFEREFGYVDEARRPAVKRGQAGTPRNEEEKP